jgi:uncharacterized oxidoreductase
MKTSENTILITGGGTGIGLALANEFLKSGNKIIICGRRENKLNEAKQKYPGLHIKTCDLSKKNERINFVNWLIQNFPDLNILINNAGVQNHFILTDAAMIDGAAEEVEINFIAPLHLSSLLIPHLSKMADPAIINITSGLAFTPLSFMPVYCATKAALHSLSLSLRHQLKDTPIKVFEMIPPTVDTELDRGARVKRGQVHYGISAEEFAAEAFESVKNDVFESAIGHAANLRLKREEMFDTLNNR